MLHQKNQNGERYLEKHQAPTDATTVTAHLQATNESNTMHKINKAI